MEEIRHLEINSLLEKESDGYRMRQAELEKKVQEMKQVPKSRQVASNAIINAMVTTYENEAVQYQESIEEVQVTTEEEDAKYKSLLEIESLLDFELWDTKR